MWTLQEVSVVRQLTFDSLADELPTLRAFVDALLKCYFTVFGVSQQLEKIQMKTKKYLFRSRSVLFLNPV